MAAVCQLSTNWYGLLVSWADSKKKSNLMLIILEPGNNAIPWLGDMRNLTLCSAESIRPGKRLIQDLIENYDID